MRVDKYQCTMRGTCWAVIIYIFVISCGVASGCIVQALEKSRSSPINKNIWRKGSRPLPSPAAPLGYGNWERIMMDSPPDIVLSCLDKSRLYIRIKVVNGAVFQRRDRLDSPYSDTVIDMIMLSSWLYQDFPDVDLYFMVGDTGHRTEECGVPELPFLQFSPNGPIDASQDAYTHDDSFIRGFSMPLPESWRHIAMTRQALEQYGTCLDNFSKAWKDKNPKVIWRGSSTGARAIGAENTYTEWLVQKQRARMTLFLQAYDWFDVGMSHIHDQNYCWNKHCDAEVLRELEKALVKPKVPLEEWAAFKASISVDGHGSPFRLPQQLLLGGVVMSVASRYKPWITPVFKPGVHYVPIKPNMEDVVYKSSLVLSGGDEYANLAAAARAQALESFHILAQLDAFMWGVMNVKNVSRWNVQPPDGDGWERIHLETHSWGAKGMPDELVSQFKHKAASTRRWFRW